MSPLTVISGVGSANDGRLHGVRAGRELRLEAVRGGRVDGRVQVAGVGGRGGRVRARDREGVKVQSELAHVAVRPADLKATFSAVCSSHVN